MPTFFVVVVSTAAAGAAAIAVETATMHCIAMDALCTDSSAEWKRRKKM